MSSASASVGSKRPHELVDAVSAGAPEGKKPFQPSSAVVTAASDSMWSHLEFTPVSHPKDAPAAAAAAPAFASAALPPPLLPPLRPLALTVVWCDKRKRDARRGTIEGLADLATQVDEQLFRSCGEDNEGLFADLLSLWEELDAPALLNLDNRAAALTKEERATLLLRALAEARAAQAAGREVDAALVAAVEEASFVLSDSDDRADLFALGAPALLAAWVKKIEQYDRVLYAGVSFIDAATGALRVLPHEQFLKECGLNSNSEPPCSRSARDCPPPFRPKGYGRVTPRAEFEDDNAILMYSGPRQSGEAARW